MVNFSRSVTIALGFIAASNGAAAAFFQAAADAAYTLPQSRSTRRFNETIPPPMLTKRFSQAAASVCQSPEFELTLENWRNSAANEFLSRWAYDFIGNREYSLRGILGSIANGYLGRNDFHCNLGTSHSCMVTCNEVVSLVADPQEARAIYFIFTSARHYLEIMEVADHALLAAQVNVGQWTDTMAHKFYWSSETDHDRVFRLTISLIGSFVSFLMFTFAPMIPFHALEKEIEAQLAEIPDNAQAPVGAAMDQAALDLISKKEGLEKKLTIAKTSAKWAEVGYNAVGNGVPVLGIPGAQLMTWEGYEKASVLNIAELGLAISQLVSDTRAKNAKAIEEAFSGRVIDGNGGTILGKIIESGAFLSTNAQMLHQWSGAQVEKRLTDALKFRILSEGMKSQGVYIHCTKDMNAFTCENDDRGPQNLKACIDDRVCYMNKWSGRGYYWRHHVEEPFGVDQMGDWPFLVTPEDIIISSYKTYKLSKGGKQMQKLINQDDLISPQNFLDASTPGAFFLPVCINDRFHQNTPLDDYTLWDNFNQVSEKKTLPCSCGEFWGDETEGFWKDTGLAMSKHEKKYRSSFCPRQLTKKMGDNKLERFVADCHLFVSKQGMFNKYKDGKHPFCDVVMDIVNAHGRSPEDMNSYLRLALECKIGLHVTSVKGKPKKECEMYMKTGFDELINKKHPNFAEWFSSQL